MFIDFQYSWNLCLCIHADGTWIQIPGLKCLHLANPPKISMLKLKKNFASIQSEELKHSIISNLDIFKKLDFYKGNQSLTIQNWNTLYPFQVLQGWSHTIKQSSRDWNAHCTLPTHKRFLCSNENSIASFHKLELIYSFIPNLNN